MWEEQGKLFAFLLLSEQAGLWEVVSITRPLERSLPMGVTAGKETDLSCRAVD